MTSTYTGNIGLERPGLDDYVNAWDGPMNANFTRIDDTLGSTKTINVNDADVALTTAGAAFHQIVLTGALTADRDLIFPQEVGGRRYIYNVCSGGFKFRVRNGAGDAGLVVPQALLCPIILTEGRAYYDNYQAVPPGVIMPYAGPSAPPGFLFCAGQSLAASDYPLLFQAIGYSYGGSAGSFLLPDTRGRVLASADDMGGSAQGRLSGYSLGVAGGEQTHLLTSGEMPSHNHTDAGHNHALTDPGHTHTAASVFTDTHPGAAQNLAPGGGTAASGTLTTNISTTGITLASASANIQNTGGGGSHNNVQPTLAINHIIRF